MASRLSELLERIRPAGTPGAPSDLISQRQQAAAEELAELVRVLSCFEVEADDVVAGAREQAARVRADAERRAEETRANLPERLAVVESSGVRQVEDRGDVEIARIAAESEQEIARLTSRAEVHLPELVDTSIEVIWGMLPASESAEVAT